MKFNQNIIIIFLCVIFLWWFVNPSFNLNESFDSKTVEFVPVGQPRYGLRGDLIRTGDIADHFIDPERQIAIHPTSEIMWESNNAPHEEGVIGCNKVNCPENTPYDNLDTCWQCGTFERKPTIIPDIWPH